jgi:molybdate transport system regulatory protein
MERKKDGGRLRVRILYGAGSVGPGKIRLLEMIRDTGSISAAARSLDMTFRRGWQLVETMNQLFREPVVKASVGGKAGGGASLTPFGEELIGHFREMEAAAKSAAAPHLRRLDEFISPDAPTDAKVPTDDAGGDGSDAPS